MPTKSKSKKKSSKKRTSRLDSVVSTTKITTTKLERTDEALNKKVTVTIRHREEAVHTFTYTYKQLLERLRKPDHVVALEYLIVHNANSCIKQLRVTLLEAENLLATHDAQGAKLSMQVGKGEAQTTKVKKGTEYPVYGEEFIFAVTDDPNIYVSFTDNPKKYAKNSKGILRIGNDVEQELLDGEVTKEIPIDIDGRPAGTVKVRVEALFAGDIDIWPFEVDERNEKLVAEHKKLKEAAKKKWVEVKKQRDTEEDDRIRLCIEEATKPKKAQLSTYSTLTVRVEPFLGIEVKNLEEEDAAAVCVTDVEQRSSGDLCGLQKDDLILSWNGVSTANKEIWDALFTKSPTGTQVKLGIIRDDQAITLYMVVGCREVAEMKQKKGKGSKISSRRR
jgi:hypothetical protein|uniref:C2 domain-containing protein n=1 Tax=Eutreptiella gymnastica TaxID=73025 RepID=A0A7S4LF96_9EUGL|mmetsp:Transcript_47675/g.79978  ORF Transcript_47675/g.79978 Transcript_47675/m.79978 type:complete len:391 (-) Transcript_47675:392-1564(-)